LHFCDKVEDWSHVNWETEATLPVNVLPTGGHTLYTFLVFLSSQDFEEDCQRVWMQWLSS
jgi:hypothetical protein